MNDTDDILRQLENLIHDADDAVSIAKAIRFDSQYGLWHDVLDLSLQKLKEVKRLIGILSDELVIKEKR